MAARRSLLLRQEARGSGFRGELPISLRLRGKSSLLKPLLQVSRDLGGFSIVAVAVAVARAFAFAFAFAIPGPLRSGGAGGRNLQGAARGCAAFLRQVSLHKQRKVARAVAARNALDLPDGAAKAIDGPRRLIQPTAPSKTANPNNA